MNTAYFMQFYKFPSQLMQHVLWCLTHYTFNQYIKLLVSLICFLINLIQQYLCGLKNFRIQYNSLINFSF